MISPLNLNSTTAGIKPVPKPPKAISFAGLGSFASKAAGAKSALSGVVSEIAATIKHAGVKSAVKIYASKAVEWLKGLKKGAGAAAEGYGKKTFNLIKENISKKAFVLSETIKNSGIGKKVTEFVAKIFK